MRLEKSLEVARSTDEVFDYLADVTNEARWNPWAKWVKKVSEGPVGPGSVFRGSYQGFGELEQDLSIYERPGRVAYHSVPKGMHGATMIIELESSATGTLVRVIGDAHPKGVMKVLEPMMRMRMAPHLNDVLEGISRELGAQVQSATAAGRPS